jgi:hypothetical protein
MSLTLTNQQINQTYQGLIKLGQSVAISATEDVLSDGLGNDSTLSLGTSSASFTGTLDLSGATVTGLNGGGLVAGTGSNSQRTADALVTNPANASGQGSLALGDGSRAEATNATAIGTDAECLTSDSIVIGNSCNSSTGPSITIGRSASANGSVATAIGNSANVQADQSIGISGENCNVTSGSSRSVVIGRQARSEAQNGIALGNFARVRSGGTSAICLSSSTIGASDITGNSALSITPGEYGGVTSQAHAIILGSRTLSGSAVLSEAGIAIGRDAQVNASADGAVALGSGVVAETSNTTTVAMLQIANYSSMNYVDDAAAATGGIPLGGVYHTAGALKIRIS